MGNQNYYTDRFIKHVKYKCKRYNIKLTIINSNVITMPEGERVAGYFIDDPLEIAIARTKSNDWLSTLVHEFSHLEQWIDNDVDYLAKYKRTHAYQIISHWINGKEYTKSTINSCLALIRQCELNCERRTIKNIIKHNLPINIDTYIKQASAYIHFYNYIKFTRTWNMGNSPISIPEILEKMPSNLDGTFVKFPVKLKQLYDYHLTVA